MPENQVDFLDNRMGAAIEWAKKNGHAPHVARVRHLSDKKKADHWRAASSSISHALTVAPTRNRGGQCAEGPSYVACS
jgi:hypothetical protein